MTQPTHGLDPNALEAALRYARPLLVKYAYTQGNSADFVREITKPVDDALAALSQNPGTSNTSGEALRAHLREHWLASIVCDHEAKTDTAICSCSQWADTPHPSVGAAVDAWIEHVFATLPAALEPRASDREAATHRHVKRGTEYVLIGFGKMQAEGWFDAEALANKLMGEDPSIEPTESIDMREVAIYRALKDDTLWVRPREEFEDGRFVKLSDVSHEH